MNKISKNRSVLRTQKMLKDGLMELMLHKPIQQITVKELTDYVDLNRGTFYLHYQDIYDLLEQLENEMLDEFTEIIRNFDLVESYNAPFPLLNNLFHFLGENANFGRMVLGKNRDQKFIDKLETILKEKCFSNWAVVFSRSNPEIYETCYAFIISGCIGIIENWLFSDMEQSAKEIAAITSQIILHGVSILEKDKGTGEDKGTGTLS